MKKYSKKILSLILAIAMIVGFAPAFEIKAAAANDPTYREYSGNSGKTFEEFWEEAYEYSDDEDGVAVTIKLMSDVTTTSRLELEWDQNIILDMNGHSLQRNIDDWVSDGQVFYMQDDAILTVRNGTISGGYNDVGTFGGGYGGAFYVEDNAQLTLEGVKVCDNATKGDGGAIFIEDNAQLTLNGSLICDNWSYENGGAIYAINSARVTITGGSIIGDTDPTDDPYVKDGNSSATEFDDHIGAAIYMDDDSSLIVNNATIRGNRASYGEVGAIYWGANGECRLIDVTISDNEAYDFCGGVYAPAGVYDTDIYLGGRVYIHNNCDYGGSYARDPRSSNLHLANDDADINRYSKLTEGSKIGITYDDLDSDLNDCLTGDESKFEEADLSYFYYDRGDVTGDMLRKVDQGSGDNRWSLFATKPSHKDNQLPAITSAEVMGAYASGIGAVIDPENRTVRLTVKNDLLTKGFLSRVSMSYIATFGYAIDGSELVGNGRVHDFVSDPTERYAVKTPNGTFEYWDITVIPEGPWPVDPVVATVNGEDYISFDAAWAAAIAEAKQGDTTLVLFADWLAGDNNSNGIIDPNETAGRFGGELGSYNDGSLSVYNIGNNLTIDLNGHKIDGNGGSRSVFRIYNIGAELIIMDNTGRGSVTGSRNMGGLGKGGAFYVSGENSVLTINGGNITGNAASDGGAIFAEGYADVVINGGNLTGNTAYKGGAIHINGADLVVNGGNIGSDKAGNTATNDGGGIYMYSGSITMTGGSIAYNTAGQGGGVSLEGGVFYFNDGTIGQNTATSGNGGGVNVIATGKLITKAGIIEHNTANSGRGGGIFLGNQAENASASTLEGTTIRNNRAKFGGGISLYQTEFCTTANTLTNVTLDGNLADVRGGGIDMVLYEDQELRLTGTAIYSGRAPEGAGIYYNSGVLYLVDSSVTGNSAANPSSGAPGIGGGIYANGENEVDVYVGGTVTIDNNTIGSAGSAQSRERSNLYLESEENDIYPIDGSPLGEGSRIGVGVNADYDDNDEEISGDGFRIADGYCFYSEHPYYHIAMKDPGGEEIDRFTLHLTNESDSRPAILAAVALMDNFKPIASGEDFVFIDGATRTLTITVNNTYRDIFSNIALSEFVVITISEDSVFADETALTAKQNFVTNPAKVYQILEEDDWGADGYDGWYSLWTIRVVPEGGQWSDEIGNVASVTTSGGTRYFYDMEMAYLYALECSVQPGGAVLKLNWNWFPNDVEEGFDYDEGTDDGCLYLNDSRINLTVDLNGFTISRGLNSENIKGYGQAFYVKAGNLTIMDSVGTGKITGCFSEDYGGAIYLCGSSVLTLNGGSITGNFAEEYGGGVYLEDDATFIMNGGSISNNRTRRGGPYTNYAGGGIYAEDDTVFTMNGGSISGNYSQFGGGIFADNSSVVTINGGMISNNDVDLSGGGIYGNDNATVIINGGTITGNTAGYGSGIYWASGEELYLNGGAIVNNRATDHENVRGSRGGYGGGVHASDDGSEPYVGGTIRIMDNTDKNGLSNLYLADKDSNLNQNTENPLREGAMIGVRLGYNDDDDCFSAEDSYFNEQSIFYLVADDPNYLVRAKKDGDDGNAYQLYLTRVDSDAAADSHADIVGASVKAEYATIYAPTVEFNVAKIPVDPDRYYAMSNGSLSLNDVIGGLNISVGASIVDVSVMDQKTDLTIGVEIQIKAADKSTIKNWLIKVVPGNESGTWNSYAVTLNEAKFLDANAGNRYYPGQIVNITPDGNGEDLFRDWSMVDLDKITLHDDGYFFFEMPANDVQISAEFYSIVRNVSITFSGSINPGQPFPASVYPVVNSTEWNVGKASIVWKIGDEVQSGTFRYGVTYTAVITLDLSEDEKFIPDFQVDAQVNSRPANSTVDVRSELVTITLDYEMPKAKILEKFTDYSAQNDSVPNDEAEFSDAIAATVLEGLRLNHKTLPVVTEDSEVNTVNVHWNQVVSYAAGSDGVPYVVVSGTVRAEDNPGLDMTDYHVTAKVYGRHKVDDPVISIETDPDNAERVMITITSDTPDATIIYTLDGSDPRTSDTSRVYYGSTGKFTPKGSRTLITVKAIAVRDGYVNSNIASVSKTFGDPYELIVNGDNLGGYTISGNNGLYRGESAVITVTPKEGYWISSIDAGAYGKVDCGTSITIRNITSDVVIEVSSAALISEIDLGTISLTPGQEFPQLNLSGNGYTVTISSWNTNAKTVAYGATYYPTICVAVAGNSYPFADALSVTMDGKTVYSATGQTNVRSFTTAITAPKSRLTAVAPLDGISINQGAVLNLPHAVSVTTDGNVITAAGITWRCDSFSADGTSWRDNVVFDSDKPGTYRFVGTLVLPEYVDADGKGEISLTVTVISLPKLRAPGANDDTENVTKSVDGETVTVRATVVELTTNVAGATIYYTINGADPVVDENGATNATQYNPAAGIVLDTSGTYVIKAIVCKQNYRTSDIATFTYVVDAPVVHTVTVSNRIDNVSTVKQTITAAEGETVQLTAENLAGKFFCGWTVTVGNQPAQTVSSGSISITVANASVNVEAVYISMIAALDITGVTAPVAYLPMDTAADVSAGGNAASWSGVPVIWIPTASAAQYGTEYIGTITLQDDVSGAVIFADKVAVTGIPGAVATKQGDALTVTFRMTAGKVSMNADLNLAPTEKLVVERGSSAALDLPETLDVSTVAGRVSVPVIWSCGSYDANVEGDYEFTANFDLDAVGVNPAGHTLSARITVSVVDSSVSLPTATLVPGIYTENQSVTLNCSTDGAVIYYTTDGTTPTSSSTQYSGPISVTGIEGQTVTTTIKAIAVDGGNVSAVATFQYTIKLPVIVPTYTVTVVGGIGGGSYQVGDTVTVKANKVDGKYFDGWTVTPALGDVDDLSTEIISFTMPAGDVSLVANHKNNSVTVIDIRMTEPAAGSQLAATISYDLSYADGTFSRANSANITWTPNDVQGLRGKAYTMSVTIPCDVEIAENCTFLCNGIVIPLTDDSIEVSQGSKTLTYQRSFETLSAAYAGHANPAPITGIQAGTAFSEIELPETVDVTTADGTTSPVSVDWIVPAGSIGELETVTITGRLRYTELAALNITGGINATVTVYVSSVEMQTVATPTATPLPGTEYFDSVTVSLSCATGGATIYYTTDGSEPTINSKRYTGPIQLTTDTVLKTIAVQSGMKNSDVATFRYVVASTYQLTVISGSGSGKYKAGDTIIITAYDDVDNYFTYWTADGIALTEEQRVSSSLIITMPANAVTITANYAPKVNKVEIGVPELELGKALPGKDDVYVISGDVTIISVIWEEQGNAGFSFYTASISIMAEHGFAEHGDVFVNGQLVPSTIDRDTGIVTLIYQTLMEESNETYIGHDFVSVPITGVPYGTDLRSLEGNKLPSTANIITYSGNTYSVGIRWDYEGCEYDRSKVEEQTFTLHGELILPAGIVGQNPMVSVEITVDSKPPVDPDLPVIPEFPVGPNFPIIPNFPVVPGFPAVPGDPTEPGAPCDGGEGCPHHNFTDLNSDAWYHEAVDYVLSKGMMNGVGGGKFAPNGATSRAMIVTILWRMEGELNLGDIGISFSDVAEGAWYAQAVKWAAANGIVIGHDGKFNPNGNITREQVATILYRYAQYKGIDTNVVDGSDIHGYQDVNSVSAWAMEAMQWAVGSGLMKGDGVNLTPASNATRCQSAALLMRFIEDVMNAED